MRALGARWKAIRRLFTIVAKAIEFFGGLIGVTFGSILVLVSKSVITNIAKSGSLTGTMFTVPMVDARRNCWNLCNWVPSGFFPARRAANLDPVEALRYE